MTRLRTLALATVLVLGVARVHAVNAQTTEDRDAVKRAVLDYVEGSYEGRGGASITCCSRSTTDGG